jgi:hypothetical protein
VLQVDGEGNVVSVMEIPSEPVVGSAPIPASRIALSQAGTVFEQPVWWGGALADYPGIIRAWDDDGRFLHYLGEVVRAGGPAFVERLSLGDFVVRGDTLWMLRRADGRLLGYDASAAESSPVVSYDLPLFFEMDAPSVILRDSLTGETSLSARRHADDFAMDPQGNFYVEQFREDGTSILATVTSDRTGYRAFDLGVSWIGALAATREYVFAAVALPGEPGRTRLLAYRSPFSDDATPASCHRAAL